MIIDVHCHVGYSARPVDAAIPRFSSESSGAASGAAFDSYFSPRLLARPQWRFLRRWLGGGRRLSVGAEFDAAIERFAKLHFDGALGADRLALLAFDEYHDDDGRAVGPAAKGQDPGTDLYVSNSLVRAMCASQPDRYLLGGSIHPYRFQEGRDACAMLEELAAAGVVLIKWLPIAQNIRADDPRTVAFLRTAARLGVAMLIHYGGEMTLSRPHLEFTDPATLLEVLRRLRTDGGMPTVIVAHAATPSFIVHNPAGHHRLMDALLGEFADDPLYADISGMASFGRTLWLRRLARRRELHRKLVWGSDFPVPVMAWAFRGAIGGEAWDHVLAAESWIERDLRLKRALGFDECVFSQAAAILKVGTA
jgi:predicted TIM-barrel fold metal-dependent hydrolase